MNQSKAQQVMDVRRWSNVLCAWRADDLAVLHNISDRAYEARQMARKAPSVAGLAARRIPDEARGQAQG